MVKKFCSVFSPVTKECDKQLKNVISPPIIALPEYCKKWTKTIFFWRRKLSKLHDTSQIFPKTMQIKRWTHFPALNECYRRYIISDSQWRRHGGEGAWGTFSPKIFSPPPQIISNVEKLYQIWQFQHRAHFLFAFSPTKFSLAPPPSPDLMLVLPLAI